MKSTDKERLEEIEKRMYHEGYDINPASVEPNQFDDDVAWLIAKVRKQAERVQELERSIETLTGINYTQLKSRIISERDWFAHQTDLVEEKHSLKQQNKRYREALEYYAENSPLGGVASDALEGIE